MRSPLRGSFETHYAADPSFFQGEKKVKNKEWSSGHFEYTPKTPSLRGLPHTESQPDWPSRSKVTAILLFSKNSLPGITVLRIVLDYGTEKK